MSIKIALLKSGETIISDAKELVSDEKPCGYIFQNPQKIVTERTILLVEETEDKRESQIGVSLSPWILLTNDDKILVPLDWVVTLVEPIDSIKTLYGEKVNGKNDQVSFTEE